jgi:hypothetical protein
LGGSSTKSLADSDIRPALRDWLRARHESDPDTVILDELGICRGRVRIDLTVVNGLLHGYEIKSERDTLARLETQADLYGRALDRATLVVGEPHFEAALRAVPRWWGILLVESSGDTPRFIVRRCGSRNPQLDAKAVVEFLWREDALALLENREAAAGLRGKTRLAMWNRICEVCEVAEIAAAARARLKSREDLAEPARQS